MPKAAVYEPELIEMDGRIFYLSDDGLGHQIAWDRCHGGTGGCGNSIMACNCKGGPREPYYITRWRAEAAGEVFVMPHGQPLRSERAFGGQKSPGTSTIFSENGSGQKAKTISDFVDDDLVAKVKAATEEARNGNA